MSSSLTPRGSTWRWRQIRATVLARDGYSCVVCGARATQVDHVVPRAAGGSDDRANLRSLCGTCHRAKTTHDSRRHQAPSSARRWSRDW